MGLYKMVDRLSQALDGASLRQKVLSHNVANANTPGFKRSDVNFKQQLSQAGRKIPLVTTDRNHRAGVPSNTHTAAFGVVQDNSTAMRNDGNNVDVEREMVLVMENQLYYQSIADKLSRNLGRLRSVIGEGRR